MGPPRLCSTSWWQPLERRELVAVPTWQVKTKLRDDEVERIKGNRVAPSAAQLVATEGDVDIYKSDGTPLLFVRRGYVPQAMRAAAFDAFEFAARRYGSDNRAS